MALSEANTKKQVIDQYKLHDTDTGSPEVQIAIITKRLEHLSGHLKEHPQDKHSKQGLLKLVSKRKRILRYLHNENIERYREALKKFGLRK